ncbi:hypothetical protein [Mycobacterium avium]|uniref:hypothetical protein n=1 Tax=Mycobacterium avium TaxID=1764 RepID=UPI001CC4D05E|nr:hypothetical protein [Mycobacterium avium]MBZ4620772.1 hypothetical protein [Mycobacterium avium subsp. hominissuis]
MATDDDQIDENPSPTAAGDETEIELAADETELAAPLTVPAADLAWSRADSGAGGDYSWGTLRSAPALS